MGTLIRKMMGGELSNRSTIVDARVSEVNPYQPSNVTSQKEDRGISKITMIVISLIVLVAGWTMGYVGIFGKNDKPLPFDAQLILALGMMIVCMFVGGLIVFAWYQKRNKKGERS